MAKDVDVLIDMRDHILDLLRSAGVDQAVAEDIAVRVESHFRNHWGGQIIYFCKSRDLSARDMEILNQWRGGRNKEELIRKYGLSEGRLYRIVAMGRQAISEKNQPKLL